MPTVVQRLHLKTAQPQDFAGAEANDIAAAELEVDLATINLHERIAPLGCGVGKLASGLKDVGPDLESGRYGSRQQVEPLAIGVMPARHG